MAEIFLLFLGSIQLKGIISTFNSAAEVSTEIPQKPKIWRGNSIFFHPKPNLRSIFEIHRNSYWRRNIRIEKSFLKLNTVRLAFIIDIEFCFIRTIKYLKVWFLKLFSPSKQISKILSFFFLFFSCVFKTTFYEKFDDDVLNWNVIIAR